MTITIKQLSLVLSGQAVLNNISAVWTSDKTVGLVGHNGSGKTMLMRCLSGMVKNYDGLIMINDQIVGLDVDFPADMGLLLETPGFIASMSAYHNLLTLARLSGKAGRERVLDVLDLVGLGHTKKKPVGQFSLGMRQRLGIAQALLEFPRLLILDEPFNGLDRAGVDEIHALLQDEKAKGTMLIVSSHHASDIARLCDDVYELENGRMRRMET